MENNFDRKKHWEQIYQTKKPQEVSWYQSTPEISLELIKAAGVPLTANILDVGGGDSLLADHLLDSGFRNISVLDISEAAIKRAKLRLGERAKQVKWIIADMLSFVPDEKYDLWHDRAAFHFLTEEQETSTYLRTAKDILNDNGILVIGTFSNQGPEKCSGIKIQQYSEVSLVKLFQGSFEKLYCTTVDHLTPFDTTQNFIFCSFRKLNKEKLP